MLNSDHKMEYKEMNYSLLKKLYDFLKSYPFSDIDKEQLLDINLDNIYNVYLPYSDIENDKVANAIIWGARTLQDLLNEHSVRDFDELISFVKSVLDERMNTYLNELKNLSERFGVFITARHQDGYYAPLAVEKEYFSCDIMDDNLYILNECVLWDDDLNKYTIED